MTDCDEHGNACAYTGHEPDRCPWCHCRWEVIVRTDWHSCEIYDNWHHDQGRVWHVARARRMRDRATHRLGLVPGVHRD